MITLTPHDPFITVSSPWQSTRVVTLHDTRDSLTYVTVQDTPWHSLTHVAPHDTLSHLWLPMTLMMTHDVSWHAWQSSDTHETSWHPWHSLILFIPPDTHDNLRHPLHLMTRMTPMKLHDILYVTPFEFFFFLLFSRHVTSMSVFTTLVALLDTIVIPGQLNHSLTPRKWYSEPWGDSTPSTVVKTVNYLTTYQRGNTFCGTFIHFVHKVILSKILLIIKYTASNQMKFMFDK